MTREERLKLLKQIEKDINVCSIESTFLDDAKSCAIHSAIEELEQEPILDKIRAEIDRQEKWLLQAGYTAYNVDIAFDAIKAVLAESEDME